MNARHGHYWCDACDEPAFGALCQRCGAAATWVMDEPVESHVGDRVKQHQAERSHQFAPVDPETARARFAQLRAALAGGKFSQ